MTKKKIELLERALLREKEARKEAEKILEDKSLELYELHQKLKIANSHSRKAKVDNSNPQERIHYSNLADAYVKIDLQGNVLEMNDSAVDLLGYDNQLEKLNVTNLVFRDDYLYSVNAFKELLKKGTFTDYISRIYIKNSPYKLVHINASVIHDNQRNPIAAEGIIRDITKESEAKKLIESQGIELNTIFNNAPFGIVLSENDRILKSNDAFQQMTGYSADELKTQDPLKLLQPTNLDEIEKVKTILESGQKNHIVIYSNLKRKGGTTIKIRSHVTSIFDENLKPKYTLSFLEDITEESRKNELIFEQKEKLEIIANNSPLGVALSNVGTLTKVNRAFCNLLGYCEEELKKMSFKDITHPDDFLEHVYNREKLPSEASENLTLNRRYIKKDGSILLAKTIVSPVKEASGKIKYQVVILEDISEQEKAENQKKQLLEQLRKSNLELKEYAHVVSHDLKAPLRSISAIVSWIREDCSDIMDERGSNNLDLIESTVEKMECLINGILSYSEIERTEEEFSLIPMGQLLENIISLLYIPQHVKVIVKGSLPDFYANEMRIRQLFQNLISNAINYMDKDEGLVEIGHIEDKEYWMFYVKDNGIGIAKQYHQKIFGMFQSLDSSKKGSTGIGLSIVKKIVELYNGEITLESKEGIGTTFYVKLKKIRH
ncbi:PAS domain-containing sensor histidine kinase [Algoriphagus pacificus]|uniref:histidine kinase n=1 Tax=Algoriphagus pacificus TaxID=2811234 RepID=A0ABS3CPV8_9BACT|nr:PAS domain-containing sensor histidine kinase [Algoriphagus pacificus]MBN7817689.1 PAS domain S-box protein [Algoriphagus pacificus]